MFMGVCFQYSYVLHQNDVACADTFNRYDKNAVSKLNSTESRDKKPAVVTLDGHYILYSTGVILDTKTQLEWFAGPDEATNWEKALKFAKRLQIAGGGWRMPTLKELETLHQKGVGTRNITPLLMTTGFWLWSGEIKEPHGRGGLLYIME